MAGMTDKSTMTLAAMGARRPRRLVSAALVAAGALAAGAVAGAQPFERPGLDRERLDRLEAHFEAQVAGEARAGYAILIAQRGEAVYERYIGAADRAAGRAVAADTPFRLASLTKPIVSLAALMLYEEGAFQLSDPVARYLPVFENAVVAVGEDEDGRVLTEPAARPVTVLDLLTHQAGVGSRDRSVNEAAARLYDALAPAYFTEGDYEDKIARLAAAPLWFHPGEKWGYGIYNTDVLGRLVEEVSGEPLDAFVQRRILDLLGMTRTGFLKAGALPEGLAVMYTHGEDGSLLPVPNHPLDGLTAPHGGGGMYSTARDYARFLRMIANGGVADGKTFLSPAVFRQMTQNALPADHLPIELGVPLPAGGFSLGFGVAAAAAPKPDSPFFEGDLFWAGSTDTFFFISPKTETFGLVMTQIVPAPGVTEWRTWSDVTALSYAALCDRKEAAGACR